MIASHSFPLIASITEPSLFNLHLHVTYSYSYLASLAFSVVYPRLRCLLFIVPFAVVRRCRRIVTLGYFCW